MTYLYHEMLDPDLYDNDFVANFVDTLLEPEIDAASEENLSTLKQEIMATDDIESLTEPLMVLAQEKTTSTGTLAPNFVAFPSKNNKISFELEKAIPTKYKHIKYFLAAGKALGMIRSAQCIFFLTIQPLIDGRPAIGEEVSDACPWGIMLIGSSLRGNCFVQIQQIIRNSENLCFQLLRQDILREGKYLNYPFSRFFHIQDANEMSDVITQIPKLIARSTLSEYEALVNFATTLKALQYFGYDR